LLDLGTYGGHFAVAFAELITARLPDEKQIAAVHRARS
jgi:hypothetical protein